MATVHIGPIDGLRMTVDISLIKPPPGITYIFEAKLRELADDEGEDLTRRVGHSGAYGTTPGEAVDKIYRHVRVWLEKVKPTAAAAESRASPRPRA